MADPTCPDTGYGAGFAWKSAGGTCYNGYAFNLTFDLTGQNISAPDNMVFGIAYNTQSWGAAPIGTDGPYTSLNVATYPGVATPAGVSRRPSGRLPIRRSCSGHRDRRQLHGSWSLGVGIFRQDTNWGGYQPAVQVSAN